MSRPLPLTIGRVRRIAERLGQGWTQDEIAAELGITGQAVNKLKRKYLDGDAPVELRKAVTEDCYRRWMNEHDIQSMGVRAVKETA